MRARHQTLTEIGTSPGQLQIRVTRGSATLEGITLRFANGGQEQLALRSNFGNGQSSRWIDLQGANRCIESIAIQGQSRQVGREATVVEFFGQNSGLVTNPGQLLGSTRLSMFPSRSSIAIQDCNLTEMRFAVRNSSATINNVVL